MDMKKGRFRHAKKLIKGFLVARDADRQRRSRGIKK